MTKEKTLKVSFVYDDSLDGNEGVAQYVKILGKWLTGRGHKVSYFVGETKLKTWSGGPIHSLAKNVNVTFNANKLSIPLLASKKSIKAALNQQQPDVLHVQVPHSPLMAQRVINSAKNQAVVGTFHIYPSGALATNGSKLLKYAYLGGLNKFQKIVSVSSAAQHFAKSSFGINTDILPNVVELSRFKLTKTKNVPGRIVFLGRLVERKGCRQLLEAFRLVHEIEPEAKLIVAGDGAQRSSLEALVEKAGLSQSVEFLGFIKEADKPDLLASASIACFPSLYGESFGLVLVEAMAAGAGVVIAGNNPGYSSVLEDNQQVLFDPRSKDDLAAKIIELLREPAKQKVLHAWQAKLVTKFDVEIVGPKLERLYYQAIDNKRDARHN